MSKIERDSVPASDIQMSDIDRLPPSCTSEEMNSHNNVSAVVIIVVFITMVWLFTLRTV